MAEYIERDAAIRIAERYGTTYGSTLGRHSGVADCIASEISGLPTADVAPVVHGRWLDGKCTNCGWEMPDAVIYDGYEDMPFEETPYCPNYGAKMDGGVDDAAN